MSASLEIERKFLVTADTFKQLSTSKQQIKQGYLNTDKARTVRVRQKGTQGFITIKGASSTDGTTRFEWEKEISITEVDQLLLLSETAVISKERYIVPNNDLFWEVDVFHEANSGLVLAEIELPSAETTFELPDWIGVEVTGDARYYNSQLTKNPFTKW